METKRGVADDEITAVFGGGDADKAMADSDDGEFTVEGGGEAEGGGFGEKRVVAAEGVVDEIWNSALVAELEEEGGG